MIRLLAMMLVLLARVPLARARWFVGRLAMRFTRWTRVRFRYVYEFEGPPYELDPDRKPCRPYLGPPCGGCDACCLAQADYCGMESHPVPVEVRR